MGEIGRVISVSLPINPGERSSLTAILENQWDRVTLLGVRAGYSRPITVPGVARITEEGYLVSATADGRRRSGCTKNTSVVILFGAIVRILVGYIQNTSDVRFDGSYMCFVASDVIPVDYVYGTPLDLIVNPSSVISLGFVRG